MNLELSNELFNSEISVLPSPAAADAGRVPEAAGVERHEDPEDGRVDAPLHEVLHRSIRLILIMSCVGVF